jgi:hypothetical protein
VLKNKYALHIFSKNVWICHLFYFVFRVKTIRVEKEEAGAEPEA